jgi:hypothetical protein
MTRKGHVSIEGSSLIELNDCREYEVSWFAEADMIYSPGHLGGPPEDCYPDESECDITKLELGEVLDDQGFVLHEDDQRLAELLEGIDRELVEDALWEAFHA